ncbi:MAG TPA: lysophospholipid acyltransferase family protein [Acidimicrobiales bacterium]
MAYRLVKAILLPVFRFFYRIRVEGLEHVPASGAAILASNHLAVCDSFFLPAVLSRRITFVAKAEYFENPKTAWFFRAVGQIPIKRGGGSASAAALDAAAEVLEAGGLFGIYPEGTRSPDGRLYKGRTGVARLALRCDVPVLPVAMVNTDRVQEIGSRTVTPWVPVTIRIGAPLDFGRYRDRATDPLVLRQITDEIMFEIRALSGQEYVNRYAKRGESAEPEVPARVPALATPSDDDRRLEPVGAIAG